MLPAPVPHHSIQSCAGDKLLIYCAGGKTAETAMKFSFQAGQWYHLAISHSSGGPLSASFVCLYVDGELQSSARFRYPKVIFMALKSCQSLDPFDHTADTESRNFTGLVLQPGYSFQRGSSWKKGEYVG